MRYTLLVLICIIFSCRNKGDYEKTNNTIHLFNNDLSTIPDSVFTKDNLRSLTISCEGFTMYPPLSALGDDDGIKYVELPFIVLSEKIGSLTSLRTLRLNGTKIKKLPSAITKLVELDTLDLSLNQQLDIISELEKLKRLPKLKFLNIYHTKLDSAKVDYLKSQLNDRIKLIITKSDYEATFSN